MEVAVISTKTSLSPLFEAVEEVRREVGLDLELKVAYTHLLDSLGRDRGLEVLRGLEGADIVLVDVRTPTSWFVEALPRVASRAKVVVPLVGGSPSILGLLKMGSLTGSFIASRARELDMDVDRLDMSRAWRMMRLAKAARRLIPFGALRHLGNWAKCVEYWELHGRRNLKNMLLLLLKEYFGVEVEVEDPAIEVEPGSIWDPSARAAVRPEDYLSSLDPSRPTVAMLMYSGMHFDQCRPVVEALSRKLSQLGVQVIPVVGGGGSRDLLRNVDYLKGCLMARGGVKVDALVNMQWFRIVGGPYGGPPEPAYELMKRLDCPLINGLIMYMREVSRWRADGRGVSPMEVVTAIALPEADGAIEPIPLAGLSDGEDRSIVAIDDRVERRALRLARWASLRRKPRGDVRLAIIIYNYPPGEHNVGSASYLDVFASLEALLRRLRDEGFSVEAPSRGELREALIARGLINAPKWSTPKGGFKVPLSEYRGLLEGLPEDARRRVVEVWGSPPGDVGVEDGSILIPGIALGNAFIGVQPSRGVHESPDKLYHSKDLPPHHQYVAFYRWIEEGFKADAVIHLGTHGTLEFLPGKEVGLSSTCYPDALLGGLPNVYVYHVTNPSEMTIAKRRGYAYVVTHLTPPMTRAELYEEYAELEELIHELREAEVQDPERARRVRELIEERRRALNIDVEGVDELYAKLLEMKRSVIPRGLHVLGRRWSREELLDYLAIALRYDREFKSLLRVLAEARGLDYDWLLDHPSSRVEGGRVAYEVLEELEAEARRFIELVLDGRVDEALARLPRAARRDAEGAVRFIVDVSSRVAEADELGAVVRALRGGYVQPRVAGDPIRTPEALPTGSHGYAFDPRLIPSRAAYLRGVKVAEDTLKAYVERHGRYPEAVAVVLWGFETAGTRGETIGQILHYLGVRPVRRHGPWSMELEVVPLEELGRPRVDVVVTICGIFRDAFPNLITMIDRAVRLVASLDEPLELNYVRKHVVELGGHVRVFGPKPGAYNTRLTELIESSAWRREEELAEVYVDDMMYGYGEGVEGEPMPGLFKGLLGRVDLATQIRYAHEYDVVDLDHYYEFLGGLRKAIESVKGLRVDTAWIDTTLERPKVRGLREAIDHAIRTRLLNPKWVEGMLSHGYDGAREVARRVEYLLGLAATTGEVPSWAWSELAERLVFNERVRERMARENPWALHEVVRRLYEAYSRGYWEASEEVVERLRREASEVEAMIEDRAQ